MKRKFWIPLLILLIRFCGINNKKDTTFRKNSKVMSFYFKNYYLFSAATLPAIRPEFQAKALLNPSIVG